MSCSILDTVVLVRDVPGHGLRADDLGAIVEFCGPDSLDIEFVTAMGTTKALVTLTIADGGPIADTDLVAVRSLERSAGRGGG